MTWRQSKPRRDMLLGRWHLFPDGSQRAPCGVRASQTTAEGEFTRPPLGACASCLARLFALEAAHG